MKRGERKRARRERTSQTVFGIIYGEKFVRMDWRCPSCRGDNILHLPAERVRMVKCGHRHCRKWSSLRELRLLNEAFAPPLNAGYEGAVKISEIDRHDWAPNYGQYVTDDQEGPRHGSVVMRSE